MRRFLRILIFAILGFIVTELSATYLVERRLDEALERCTGLAGSLRVNSFPTTLSLARGIWGEALWTWEEMMEGEIQGPGGERREASMQCQFRLHLRGFRWGVNDALLGRPPAFGGGEAQLCSVSVPRELLSAANEWLDPGFYEGCGIGETLEFMVQDASLAVYAKNLDLDSRIKEEKGNENNLNGNFSLLFLWKPRKSPLGSSLVGCRRVREKLEMRWALPSDGPRISSFKEELTVVEALTPYIEGLGCWVKAKVKCRYFLENPRPKALDRQYFVV